MARNTLLSAGVVVSLMLSSASVGYQVAKDNKTSKFSKYQYPAKITQLEYKLILADIQMIKDRVPMENGIGIGKVTNVSDNNITVRVLVSEKNLPSGHKERRDALLMAAVETAVDVKAQFETDEVQLRDITVEFKSVEDMVQNSERIYATYSHEELTLH